MCNSQSWPLMDRLSSNHRQTLLASSTVTGDPDAHESKRASCPSSLWRVDTCVSSILSKDEVIKTLLPSSSNSAFRSWTANNCYLKYCLSYLYFLRLLETRNGSFRMPLNITAMSIWSSSSSDTSSEIYGIRYHSAQATAPSLENVEKLLQQQAAIQEEIAAQLSAISAAVDKDIQVTKKCVYFPEPCSMPLSM